MALSYKARKRWAIFALVVALPAYIVVAVTIMNALDRPPIWLELVIYVALGIVWAFPLKAVFRGVGQADPDSRDP
jgi:predicted membrane channel-forming protein YqfA (hemolysin III family)